MVPSNHETIAEPLALFGTWRLLSCEVEFLDTGDRERLYGDNPQGRLILGPDHMMMALLHGDAGTAGRSRFMSYSGRFRIEPPEMFVTEVDMAWDDSWLGAHPRYFKLTGDFLDVVTPAQMHPAYPARMIRSYMRWRREAGT